MAFFVGIDVSKLTLEACKLCDGKPLHRKFPHSPSGFRALLSWIARDAASHTVMLAMEATGSYHLPLAHFAHAHDLRVFVLNPTRLKHYAHSQPRRAKTDREDARLIATYLSKHHEQLHVYTPPRQAVADLRHLVRRREQLIKMLKQEENRVRELATDHILTQSHQRVIHFLTEEKQDVDQRIDQLLKEDEQLQSAYKRLRTVPQVGRILAVSLLAEMGDGKAFEKSKNVTAWLGLAPLMQQSGTSVYKEGRISHGNSMLRKALYMSALGAMRNGTWEAWLKPHRERGKSGKVLMVALMDKIARVCWGIMKTQHNFDPKRVFLT